MRGVHLTREEAEAQAKAGGGRPSSPNLIYHGGPILKTTSAGAIFWGPSWANSTFVGDKITGIDSWYQGVTASTYARTSDEYTDSSGQVTAGISYLGHVIDLLPRRTARRHRSFSPKLVKSSRTVASQLSTTVSAQST
jgi:hypothetical protein